MEQENTTQPDKVIDTGKSIISFYTEYPEENPKGAINDITEALAYAGVFDGIK